MPAQKSAKSVQPSKPSPIATKKVTSVPASKPPVPKSKAVQLQEAADALLAAGAAAKKKPGRPPKAAVDDGDAAKPAAKRGRKPKSFYL